MTQSDGEKLLQSLISEVDELPVRDEERQDAVIRRAKMVIGQLFGQSSQYLKDIGVIYFYPRFQSSYTDDSDLDDAWDSGRNQLSNLLSTVLEQIQTFGINHTLSATSDDTSHLQDSVPSKTETEDVKYSEATTDSPPDPRNVFVVHGRNENMRQAMFAFLRAINLSPIEWSEAVRMTGKASPYVGEIIDSALENSQAVVVLMTGDDEARLRDRFAGTDEPAYERDLTPQPRQNVTFEAGLALGRAPNRTILVEIGELRPMSDIGGRHTVRLNNSAERRNDLAQRLEAAGCEVRLRGNDWLNEGDFVLSIGTGGGNEDAESLNNGEVDSFNNQRLDLEPKIELSPFVDQPQAQLRVINSSDASVKCQANMMVISTFPSDTDVFPYPIKWKGLVAGRNESQTREILGHGTGVLEIARHASSNGKTRQSVLRLLRADVDNRRDTITCDFDEPVRFEIEILTNPPLSQPIKQVFVLVDSGGGISEFRTVGADGR